MKTSDTSSKHRTKANLPQKICATCQRPFVWRKKWERDWESVRYCSERCLRGKADAVHVQPS